MARIARFAGQLAAVRAEPRPRQPPTYIPKPHEGGKAMKNVLALAAFVVIVFGGVGWYLGWYQVHSIPGQGGHQQVTIDVNAPKIGADLQKGESKLSELIKNGQAQGQPAQTTSQDQHPHKKHRPENPGTDQLQNTSYVPPVPQVPSSTNLPPAPGAQPITPTPPASQTPTPPPVPPKHRSWFPFGGHHSEPPQPPVQPPAQPGLPNAGTFSNGGNVALPGAPANYDTPYGGGQVPPR
jgi:hypothetical protein